MLLAGTVDGLENGGTIVSRSSRLQVPLTEISTLVTSWSNYEYE
jgi:hypothetical protein